MSVRARTFALVVEFELVRVGYFDAFGDVIHRLLWLRIGQPSAKILILCDMNKPEGWCLRSHGWGRVLTIQPEVAGWWGVLRGGLW